MKLEEYLKDKDVICSTNIKLTLYRLAESLGTPKSEIQLGLHDEKFGQAKQRIYEIMSERLDFKFEWDGHYKIKEKS